jgi:circadian clock protein KaiC
MEKRTRQRRERRQNKKDQVQARGDLPRAATGISGLDEITGGGLPRGASTLVCGPAGSGKTVFGIEFALHGALEGEPAVYLSFEETREKILRNVASLGHDPKALERRRKLLVEFIDTRPQGQVEVGDFELTGLFIRLERAIDKIKAARVVVDGAEALFSAFQNRHIVRRELGHLFRWLETKGVTCVFTSEQGQGTMTRHGMEEYLADCVIFLDHRISDQLSTRRLRVVKYRGAPHSTDDFPFLIDEDGICVLPLTSLGLNHSASDERVSTGIKSLDEMFGGKGFFRGSSILVSGTAGTGKSSIAATFINAACARGEAALYFAFEESKEQICRNMRSIGLDLDKWVRKGLLCFETFRPTVYGLESHLSNIEKIVSRREPKVVVIDPITNFSSLGTASETKNMLMRLIDYLKTYQITALFTSLTEGGAPVEQSSVGVSSLIDTWMLVRDIEMSGERNRGLYVLKSRGMAHSNQIREFVITNHGLDLVPVYVGQDGNIFIGAARAAKMSEEAALRKESEQIEAVRGRIRGERLKAFEAEQTAAKARYEVQKREIEVAELLEQRLAQKAARAAEKQHRLTVINEPPIP